MNFVKNRGFICGQSFDFGEELIYRWGRLKK